MNLIEVFITELDKEAIATKKMLAAVPFEKADWKPHAKSMSMQQLTTHIAEIPGWISLALKTSVLDFNAGNYEPSTVNDTKELVDLFEKNHQTAKDALLNANEAELMETFTMKGGDKIYSTELKHETIRHSLCQIVHHRAQLGVYLRLLDIPIPASYGNSADDAGMFANA